MPQWRAARQAPQEGRDQAEADQGAGGGNARARREDQALRMALSHAACGRRQSLPDSTQRVDNESGTPSRRGPASVFQAPAARPGPAFLGKLMVKAAPAPGRSEEHTSELQSPN